MPECVNLRLDLLDGVKQIFAASSLEPAYIAESTSSWSFIASSIRRSVRDQNICLMRNQIPVLLDVCSSVTIECPVKKARLYRRAPKSNAFQLNSAVLQVMNIRRKLLQKHCYVRWIALLKVQIMVARNEDLVLVRLCAKPIDESQRIHVGAMAAEVAAVYQNVCVWQLQTEVRAVRIRNEADLSHFKFPP